MTNGRRHPAYLPVSPFPDRQLEPAVGHALAESYRRIAGPKGGSGNALDLGRPGQAVFQMDALPQRHETRLFGIAFDLHEIGLQHLELGISDPRLQSAVVGEQEQPLAIEIEPPRRINAWQVDEIRQRSAGRSRASIRKLAKHAIWFVEQDQPRHGSSLPPFLQAII